MKRWSCGLARERLGYQQNVSFLTPSILPTHSFQVDHTIDYSMFDWQSIWSYDVFTVDVFLPIGLYGVYMAVFSLAVWTMYRDGKRFSGVSWVVVATFVVATLYIVALLVSVTIDLSTGSLLLVRLYCVVEAWCSMSPCICCTLSDCILAWRCYVIFGKRRWLKWTLTVVVLVVTVSGIFPSIADLLANLTAGTTDLGLGVAFSTAPSLAWAVCSLVLNTVLSTSIIAKIVIVSRQTRRHFASSLSIPLARAFIESSLLSWIALAVCTSLYTAEYLAPWPAVESATDGQDALEAILPLIFSISQALVIARLGISRFAASTSFKDTIVALTSDGHDDNAPRSLAVAGRDAEAYSNQE